MKKNVLALSIAAMIGGFAGAASAGVLPGSTGFDSSTGHMDAATATDLELSDNGKGHMLVVPYYTAQDNNITVLHVVNTDSKNGKALKVRFRGAANSDDVLDFTVFLSPSDVWTGYVSKGSDGLATFTTGDTSCILPADVTTGPKSFSLERLSNSNWSTDVKANHTREGYVEILNMADIPTQGNPDLGATQTKLWSAVKHNGGAKPTCDAATLAVTAALYTLHGTGKEEAAAAKLGLNTPTGGLFGDWYIQNVPKSTTYSGSAPAVIAVDSSGAPARGNYVFFSQVKTDLPDPTALANTYSADPLLYGINPALNRQVFDYPDLSTPYTAGNTTDPNTQASLLSTRLAVTNVANQYATDAGISAQTDWTLSMPTRRYALAANYKAIGTFLYPANYIVVNGGVRDLDKNKPFFNFDVGSSLGIVYPPLTGVAANVTADSSGRLCVRTASNSFFDREEQQKTNIAVSPGNTLVQLCGEVSVLSITTDGNGPGVLGGSVANSFMKAPFTNGWGSINAYADADGTLSGRLPLMGHSFTKLYNPSVTPGTAGNFGITWAHRFDR